MKLVASLASLSSLLSQRGKTPSVRAGHWGECPARQLWLPMAGLWVLKVHNGRGRLIGHAQRTGFCRAAFTPGSARGSSLLEVLVAIVILSFGMLGIAGLQASALRLHREAERQSTASLLARDYAELMRNNPAVAHSASSVANPYLMAVTASAPSSITKSCVSHACSANETALWDRQEWLMRIFEHLPGAKVEVCFDTAPFESTGDVAGLPKSWGTCSHSGTVVLIKVGWQQTTGEAVAQASGASYIGKLDAHTRPAMVLPVAAVGVFGSGAMQ